MKKRSRPLETKFGNYIEQSLVDGLTEKGKRYAIEQVKRFEAIGIAVPYGLIRKLALKIV